MTKDVVDRLSRIAERMEKARFIEYLAYAENRKRQFFLMFMGGVLRGLGFMIGFTVIGAFAVTVLRHIVIENIPGIGDFLAEVLYEMQKRTG